MTPAANGPLSQKPWIIELTEWADEHGIAQISNITTNTPPENLENVLLNITELDLSHKTIDHFPDAFANLSKIKRLSMHHMRLESLPEVITALASLEHLDLSHNRLRTLPEDMVKLTSLEVLDVSWNRIVPKPSFLSAFKNVNSAWNRK